MSQSPSSSPAHRVRFPRWTPLANARGFRELLTRFAFVSALARSLSRPTQNDAEVQALPTRGSDQHRRIDLAAGCQPARPALIEREWLTRSDGVAVSFANHSLTVAVNEPNEHPQLPGSDTPHGPEVNGGPQDTQVAGITATHTAATHEPEG